MRSCINALSILLTLLAALPSRTLGALPHVEQLSPGVFAAGFADRYGSANCGWVATGDGTLLIDLPQGIGASEFLAEVEKSSGKPARSFVLTHEQETDAEFIAALLRLGLRQIATGAERGSIGNATTPVEFIPYGRVCGQKGGAVFLPRAKVL